VETPKDWVFGLPGQQRFTQDSPVLPTVWLRYAEAPDEPHDLLLTPHQDHSAAELLRALKERGLDREGAGLAYNEGYVVARLGFGELVRDVVPLSDWWRRIWSPALAERAITALEAPEERLPKRSQEEQGLAWYLALVGWIASSDDRGPEEEHQGSRADRRGPRESRLLAFAQYSAERLRQEPTPRATPLWTVSLNRSARTALSSSRLAVKADAAERVFETDCSKLRWAIIDTGIDATHPAFRRRRANGRPIALPKTGPRGSSRVLATYDFTRMRSIVAGESGGISEEDGEEIRRRIERGRALDWASLAPLLRITHERGYRVPPRDHGTHVAGIVGGDWRLSDPEMPALTDLIGICPDIGLYDLRVFGDDEDADEYGICAALQFVRYLNSHSDTQVIHGANLSLSLDHDLENFAVGRTPICDECERLSASGVVVAVAAGNEGQTSYRGEDGERDGFRTVAITDPGNAEEVITVGSTHRRDPHTYGVSYFSSRGPTGDGRAKPDLVAPGEKVQSPVPAGGFQAKDGTSQATAHVSGVAAMLLARNPELIGQPRRIKRILRDTATDLGREPYFQGAGLVDALRALQEV
jgi:serine protease AprX